MCKPYRKSATPAQPRAAARCVAKGEIADETRVKSKISIGRSSLAARCWLSCGELRYMHSLASANKSSKKIPEMWVYTGFLDQTVEMSVYWVWICQELANAG